MKNNLPNIVIRNESEAYKVLEKALNGTIGDYDQLIFDGWPTLKLYLKGEKYDQSVTYTVMKGLIELQKGVYQSYASAKFNNPTKRLSEEEKKELELKIKVNKGSSDLEINFTEIASKLIENLGSKMTGTQILITVVSISVLYFGDSAYTNYLENRKEIRLADLRDKNQRDTIEALSFNSAEETKRTAIIAQLAQQNSNLNNIPKIAYDTQTSVVRSLGGAELSKIGNNQLTPEIAEILTQNARRKSTEVRLDGEYRLLKVDWTDLESIKIKIRNVKTGFEIDAVLQDDSLTGEYKRAIKEAGFARSSVELTINAEKFDESTFKNVVIVSAKLPNKDQKKQPNS